MADPVLPQSATHSNWEEVEPNCSVSNCSLPKGFSTFSENGRVILAWTWAIFSANHQRSDIWRKVKEKLYKVNHKYDRSLLLFFSSRRLNTYNLYYPESHSNRDFLFIPQSTRYFQHCVLIESSRVVSLRILRSPANLSLQFWYLSLPGRQLSSPPTRPIARLAPRVLPSFHQRPGHLSRPAPLHVHVSGKTPRMQLVDQICCMGLHASSLDPRAPADHHPSPTCTAVTRLAPIGFPCAFSCTSALPWHSLF
jgi:hypothetical protein